MPHCFGVCLQPTEICKSENIPSPNFGHQLVQKRSAAKIPPKLISNRSATEMNRIVATMDDLPELPFEKVLSYLSLEDRLKARAVSRRWYHKINCFRPKCLCYSSGPNDSILGKSRWVSGAFAENFISSTRFTAFFDTFGQTILSSLKHLRLCDLDLREEDPATFTRTLNSFGQLEKLNIIRIDGGMHGVFKLNLPMLTSLQIDEVHGIDLLTLEAPRLRDVKILVESDDLRVEIVHNKPVKKLLIDWLEHTEVEMLKNLQCLYVNSVWDIHLTFLSSLQQLKEIHTNHPGDVEELFEQKQRYGRTDLKIYICGLLLNGPDDPAINAIQDCYPDNLAEESLAYLAENSSRLADQIPFYRSLRYSAIENVTPGLEVDLLKRFTDLNMVCVNGLVQDPQRFLDLLKNCKNIVVFEFDGDQPQDLFDRLPEHCAVQKLTLDRPPSDLDFLFQLKHLIFLKIDWSIGIETVRRAFEQLPALSSFKFRYDQKKTSIEIDQVSKQFEVWIDEEETVSVSVSGLNAAIEFITGNEKPSSPKKRKAEALESSI